MSTRADGRRSVGDRLCAVAVASAALVALSGCSSFASDPVKKLWESRDSLTSCGSLHLGQIETVEVDGKQEIACLQRALESGSGAELTVRRPTTEGDQVTDYYRVTAEGSTEVYTDASQDGFSDGKWVFASCDDPDSVLDVNC